MAKINTKRGISHYFHAVFIKGHSSGHHLFTSNVSGICVAFLESVCSSITLWSSSMPLVLILSSAMICSAGVWQKLQEQTGVEVQALKVLQSWAVRNERSSWIPTLRELLNWPFQHHTSVYLQLLYRIFLSCVHSLGCFTPQEVIRNPSEHDAICAHL